MKIRVLGIRLVVSVFFCSIVFAQTPSRKSAQSDLKIQFEGLTSAREADVLKFFRERGVTVAKDQRPTPEVIDTAVVCLKEFLRLRGYLQARVDAVQDLEANAITFLITEGPVAKISGIRFQGNKVFSSETLVSKMQEILSHYDRHQDKYDAELFDLATRLLINFVRSQGYLQARTSDPGMEITKQGLVITIPIEEGLLYRLGNIEIEGAKHLAPEAIRAMFSLQSGDIAKGDFLGKWLFEDLKKVYGSIGFIQFTAEPEPVFRTIAGNKSEGVVDFRIYIDEGAQFRIRSLKLVGTEVPNAALPAIFMVHEGDIFDEELFEKSISRLNQIGLFKEIDKDKDTNFLTDSELGVLDIVIKVSDKRFEPQVEDPEPKRAN